MGFIFFLSLMGCDNSETDTLLEYNSVTAQEGVAENLVILILDGARIEETIGEGNSDAYNGPVEDIIPQIRQKLLPIAASGIAYSNGITFTTPAHHDMLTSTDDVFENLPAWDDPGLYLPVTPTIFEAFGKEKNLNGESIKFLANASLLADLNWSLYPGFGENFGAERIFIGEDGNPSKSDEPVIKKVRESIESGSQMIVANLHYIDWAGHNEPEIYWEQVANMDRPIVEIWRYIQGDERYRNKTLLLVLADHGRHRDWEEPDYQHHGCHCSGCREVPLIMLGPGVKQGHITQEHYTLQDIGRTVSYLMGFDLPHAQGLVMDDMLIDPVSNERSGSVKLSSSGDLLARQVWRDDSYSRSYIQVNDDFIQDFDKLHVEEPKVLSTPDRDYLCYRELEVATSDDIWPWKAQCAYKEDGQWVDMGLDKLVWPRFSPSLAATENGLKLLFVEQYDNGLEQGIVSANYINIGVLTWSKDSGWEKTVSEGLEGSPNLVSITELDGSFFYSYLVGETTLSARHTMHVEVMDEEFNKVFVSDMKDDNGIKYNRENYPEITEIDGELNLSWLGYNTESTSLLIARTYEGVWKKPHKADSDLLPNVKPKWSDSGELFYVKSADKGTQVCRFYDFEISCKQIKEQWVDSLAVIPSGVALSVHNGDMDWSIVEVVW